MPRLPPGWIDRKAKGKPTFSHTRLTLRLVSEAFMERTRAPIAAGSSCGTTRAVKAVAPAVKSVRRPPRWPPACPCASAAVRRPWWWSRP